MQTWGMLIGVDASRAAIGARTGTENYAVHLIQAMTALPASHQFRLYFNAAPPADLFIQSSQVAHRIIPWPRLWTHLRLGIEVAVNKPDVLFVPSHVLPLTCATQAVVTIHDLGHRAHPETHRPFDRWYLEWTTRRHVQVATHILADSIATRRDLIELYQANPERISVIYPGLNPGFHTGIDRAQIDRTKKHYGVRSDYIIHVGTLHPRKNLARLLDAFKSITSSTGEQLTSQCQLVLAGKPGWFVEDILSQADDMGHRVLITGHVKQSHLPALIAGARALVMPSLYEGFGFPVLEAMACGTPVVAANVSSLPEVAGDAAILVDPINTDQLAKAVLRVLCDENLRNELRTRGLERTHQFTWQQAAQQTLSVLENLQPR